MLVQLAWNTVQGARKACGEYDELTREVSILHRVLQRLQQDLVKPDSVVNRADDDRKQELDEIVGGAEKILKIMDSFLKKYNALGDNNTSGRKLSLLRQKIQFGNGEVRDLAEIRQKLSFYTSAISMSLNLCSLDCLGRIENRLNRFESLEGIERRVDWNIACLVAKTKEGTVWTSHTEDDKGFWRELRHELIEEGYSSSALHRHKHLIKAYIEELGNLGVFDQDNDETETFRGQEQQTSGLKLPNNRPVTGSAELLPHAGQSAGQSRPYLIDPQTATPITVSPKIGGMNKGFASALPVQIEDIVDEEFVQGAHPNVVANTPPEVPINTELPIREAKQQTPPSETPSNAGRQFVGMLLSLPPATMDSYGLHFEKNDPTPTSILNEGAPPVTNALLEEHGLSKGSYSHTFWDPREKPIIIAGNIFDAYSLGRWMCRWCSFTWGVKSKELQLAHTFGGVIRELSELYKKFSVEMSESTDHKYATFLMKAIREIKQTWNKLQELVESPSPRLAWLQAANPQLVISDISYIKHILNFKDPPPPQPPQPPPSQSELLRRVTLGTSPRRPTAFDQNHFEKIGLFMSHMVGLDWGHAWFGESNSTVDLLVRINEFIKRIKHQDITESTNMLCHRNDVLVRNVQRKTKARGSSKSKR